MSARVRPVLLPVLFAALPSVALAAAAEDDEIYGPPIPKRSTTQPEIFCAQPTFDFGTVFEGEKVKHGYAIENRGEGVLRIEQVRPSCHCTVSRFDREIQPGGTGYVWLELDTKGISSHTKKYASVFSNDPRQRTLRLTLEGEVKRLIRFEPRYPRIRVVQGPGTVTTDVKILSGTGDAIQILEIKPQSQDVKCELEAVEEGVSYVLHITVPKSGSRIWRYESIHIKAKAGEREISTTLRVSIQLTKRIRFQRRSPYVNFFRQETRKFLRGEVSSLKKGAILENVENQPFEVTGVEPRHPWIKATAEKIGDGAKWRIWAQVVDRPAKMTSKVARTSVIVRTNDPAVPELQLHVMATF